MPQISFKESDQQIRAINDRVREAEKSRDWDAAIAGLHELLDPLAPITRSSYTRCGATSTSSTSAPATTTPP